MARNEALIYTPSNPTSIPSFFIVTTSYAGYSPGSSNDSLKVYKDVSTNFGTKNTLYNQSVPMKITLVPLAAVSFFVD